MTEMRGNSPEKISSGRRRLLVLALTGLALLVAGPAMAQRDRRRPRQRPARRLRRFLRRNRRRLQQRRRDDNQRARRALRAGEVRPLRDVLRAVRPHVRGELLDIGFDRWRGRWTYQLLILTPLGRYREVLVDANTMEILNAPTDGPARDYYPRDTPPLDGPARPAPRDREVRPGPDELPQRNPFRYP